VEVILKKMKLELIEEITKRTLNIRKVAGQKEEIMDDTEIILRKVSMLSKVITHLEQELKKLETIQEEINRIKLEAGHEQSLAEEAEKETLNLINEDMDVNSTD